MSSILNFYILAIVAVASAQKAVLVGEDEDNSEGQEEVTPTFRRECSKLGGSCDIQKGDTNDNCCAQFRCEARYKSGGKEKCIMLEEKHTNDGSLCKTNDKCTNKNCIPLNCGGKTKYCRPAGEMCKKPSGPAGCKYGGKCKMPEHCCANVGSSNPVCDNIKYGNDEPSYTCTTGPGSPCYNGC